MSTAYYLFILGEMTKFQASRRSSLFCSMCPKCLKQFLAYGKPSNTCGMNNQTAKNRIVVSQNNFLGLHYGKNQA